MSRASRLTYEILSKYLEQQADKVVFYPDRIMIHDSGAVLTLDLAGLPVGTILQQVIISGNKVEIFPDHHNVDRVEFQIYSDNGTITGVNTIYFQPPRYRLDR